MAKHKHYEAIVAWAESKPIQWRRDSEHPWNELDNHNMPGWYNNYEYRVKPIEYPKSNLSYIDLCNIINKASKKQELFGSNEGYQTTLARMAADEAVEAFLKDEAAMMAWLKQSGLVVVEGN